MHVYLDLSLTKLLSNGIVQVWTLESWYLGIFGSYQTLKSYQTLESYQIYQIMLSYQSCNHKSWNLFTVRHLSSHLLINLILFEYWYLYFYICKMYLLKSSNTTQSVACNVVDIIDFKLLIWFLALTEAQGVASFGCLSSVLELSQVFISSLKFTSSYSQSLKYFVLFIVL